MANVPRYVYVNLPLPTQIGAIPQKNVYQVGYYSSLDAMGVGSSYGDMICFSSIYTSNGGYHGFQLVRIKKDGTWCVYTSSDVNQLPRFQTGYNCRQIGPNTYTVNTTTGGGADYIITLPDMFVAGGNFRLSAPSTKPNAPCGVGGSSNVFYMPQQGIVAYEYTQALAGNTNYWASIYEGDLINLTLVNAGYIGNRTNPIDPFNRTQLSLPLPFSSLITGSGSLNNPSFMNGAYVYYGPATGGTKYFGAVQYVYNTNNVPLVCGGAGNAYTYISTTNQWQYDTASTRAVYGNLFPGDFGKRNLAYTEIPGLYMWTGCQFGSSPTRYGVFLMSALTCAFIELPLPIMVGYLFADGTFLGAGYYAQPNIDISIYKFKLDLYALGLLPLAQISAANYPALLNWSRPISLNGEFIA